VEYGFEPAQAQLLGQMIGVNAIVFVRQHLLAAQVADNHMFADRSARRAATAARGTSRATYTVIR